MSFFSSTIQLRESEALALEIKVSLNGVKSRVLSIGNTIKRAKRPVRVMLYGQRLDNNI